MLNNVVKFLALIVFRPPRRPRQIVNRFQNRQHFIQQLPIDRLVRPLNILFHFRRIGRADERSSRYPDWSACIVSPAFRCWPRLPGNVPPRERKLPSTPPARDATVASPGR